MINRLLIANRGEIACRIIKTARKLGIETIAIFSHVDSQAPHVRLADRAFCVGAAPAQDSYLHIENIIKIAQQQQVDAIHPGYGFLSENATFAKVCEEQGIIFVGPSADAIDSMGSKSQAKHIMQQAGVPTIPGFQSQNHQGDSAEILFEAAEKMGYPVMLKAVAGGGGKGMRVVHQAEAFMPAFDSASREAKANFADDRMLLEKYIVNPRHIEMQIFADQQGHYVHLFERDCSVQRRHQKIIEEAPAPHLTDETRQALATAAIDAARAINYHGAGTVEFLMDEQQQFYFMEMNTRLQVEHPITEMITGLDLVELQLRIASKQALPFTQADIKKTGHAIEVRICAEDPYQQFLPAVGRIDYLALPKQDAQVRVDTGVDLGGSISPYYDSMLAKLIVHAENREQALKKLRQSLEHYHIQGLTTNLPFLQQIIQHPHIQRGEYSTSFIETNQSQLLSAKQAIPEKILLLLTVFAWRNPPHNAPKVSSCIDPYSPWLVKDGWQANLTPKFEFEFVHSSKQTFKILLCCQNDNFDLWIGDQHYCLTQLNIQSPMTKALLEDEMLQAHICQKDQEYTVFYQADTHHFRRLITTQTIEDDISHDGGLTAPMPGTVIDVKVHAGDRVKQGDVLLIIEAMKMEHPIIAPNDGFIKTLSFNKGDMVNEGEALLEFEVTA